MSSSENSVLPSFKVFFHSCSICRKNGKNIIRFANLSYGCISAAPAVLTTGVWGLRVKRDQPICAKSPLTSLLEASSEKLVRLQVKPRPVVS